MYLRRKTEYSYTRVYYAIFSTSNLFIFLCFGIYEMKLCRSKGSALMDCAHFVSAFFCFSGVYFESVANPFPTAR